MQFHKLLLLGCFLLPAFLAAQNANDSIAEPIDSTHIYYYLANTDSLTLEKLHHVDTMLQGIQNYDPLFRHGRFYENLGNLGLPAENMIFNPTISPGFSFSRSSSHIYLYDPSQLKYYRPLKPYTDLYYVMGPEKEQYFRGIHSQKISRNFTFGIDFRFIFSPGIYERRKADDKNLSVSGQYFTDNKRYGVIAAYVHNKNIFEESGGIKYDSLFTQNLEDDRRIYLPRLEDAENTVKWSAVYLDQYFFISPIRDRIADTLDSIPRPEHKFHLGKLSHTFKWSRQQFAYRDGNPVSGFYALYDPPLDSTATLDSLYVTRLENHVGWSNLGPKDQPEDKAVYVHFGIKHQITKVGDTLKDRTFHQFIPAGGFSIFLLKSFRLNFDLNIVTGDYNGGDFDARAQIKQYLGTRDRNLGLLTLEASLTQKMPDWFFQQYNGNNLRWENNFARQEYIIGKVNYRYKNLKAGARLYQLKNYVYFDSLAHPRQYGPSFSVFQLFLDKAFHFGEFSTNFSLNFQQTSKKEIIRLPDFAGLFNIYWTKALFNSATTIQPGISMRYHTAYFADAYMPALRSFHNQHNTEIGNFFIADAYINVKIKRVRIFLKYAHGNAGFTGYNYFGAPHYPLKDARIYFGLSWIFYD